MESRCERLYQNVRGPAWNFNNETGKHSEVVFKRLQPRLKIQGGDLRHCSPPVPSHLEDFAPRSSL
jgi:hypothetical protein